MTEAEWLASTDPEVMLEFLGGEASDRKLRLFAIACCRRVWHLLNDEQGQRAVEVGEQCADGLLTVSEAYAIAERLDVFFNYDLVERLAQESGVYWEAISLALFSAGLTTGWLNFDQTFKIARNVAGAVACQAVAHDFGGDDDAYQKAAGPFISAEYAAQSPILRDIFTNPFRPVAVDPDWLTPIVLESARTLYEDRAFDRMSELADALETAGCNNADILDHCRGPGPHVRGCWVVDLILGKE